jgi:hypothetical protein
MTTKLPSPEPAPTATGWRPLASLLALAVAVLAGLWRVMPHPPNLTPIGGLGVFAGARLRLWQALALPVAVLLVSDALQGFRPSPVVYGSFLLNVLLGRLLYRSESPWRIGLVSVLASVQFFLVTNFGVWAGGTLYPQTLEGLGSCYLEGLPYFGNTLLGDLGFAVILFGAHALLTRTAFPMERIAPARPQPLDQAAPTSN